jgi:phosphate-selective porin OprO and OprP
MSKSIFSLMLAAGLLLGMCATLDAQQTYDGMFGKGIHVVAQDSSYAMKVNFRTQSLMTYDGVTSNWLVRRMRLKLSGFAHSPRLQYKVELGLSNRDHGGESPETSNTSNLILDAFVRYKVAGNLELWLGQTKLPGNRERVISSQKLQFVDRSLLNSRFNLDRDMGVQLRNTWSFGAVVTRQALAISQGEGRNRTLGNRGGLEYTGRLEVMPLGEFAGQGDYFGADLLREERPRLALGLTYDYNDGAARQKGNTGSYVPDTATNSLSTVLADFMFKYRGLSVMGEYASKAATGERLFDGEALVSNYYTGTGVNIQAGYLFESDYEWAVRYTAIRPELDSARDLQDMYTLGLSKYIVGHSLKLQSDVSYVIETNQQTALASGTYLFRFQMELAF